MPIPHLYSHTTISRSDAARKPLLLAASLGKKFRFSTVYSRRASSLGNFLTRHLVLRQSTRSTMLTWTSFNFWRQDTLARQYFKLHNQKLITGIKEQHGANLLLYTPQYYQSTP